MPRIECWKSGPGRATRRRFSPRSLPRSTRSNGSRAWPSRRFGELGYANVHVRLGDGSRGWPEHAPYDAIVVTASGPEVPTSLLRQLAIGGRLVMPVGPEFGDQRLIRITRTSAASYERETLDKVAFVPLIG